MKREDISKLFPEATEEQISALLDINSRDIGKAKGDSAKAQSDLDAANAALKEAQNTIAALEAAKGDAEALQKQIDEYKAADDKRKAEEKAAAERAELMERMDAVMDGRKFIHDRMRDLVAEDFGAALKDRANRGKADKDIFDAVTLDKGYFASQNPPAPNMPGFNPGLTDPDANALSDAEYYAKVFAKQ